MELNIKAKKHPCKNSKIIVNSMETQVPICEVRGTISAKKHKNGRKLRLDIKELVNKIVGNTKILPRDMLFKRALVYSLSYCRLTIEFKSELNPKACIKL